MLMPGWDMRRVGAEEHRRNGDAMARRHHRAEREGMSLEPPAPGRVRSGRIAGHYQGVVAGISEAQTTAQFAQHALDLELSAHLLDAACAEQGAQHVPGCSDLLGCHLAEC